MTELRECPFCGGTFLAVYQEHEGQPLWYVTCTDCTGEVGARSTEEAAIATWNRRVSQWQPVPDDVEIEGCTIGGNVAVVVVSEESGGSVLDIMPPYDTYVTLPDDYRLCWKVSDAPNS